MISRSCATEREGLRVLPVERLEVGDAVHDIGSGLQPAVIGNDLHDLPTDAEHLVTVQQATEEEVAVGGCPVEQPLRLPEQRGRVGELNRGHLTDVG